MPENMNEKRITVLIPCYNEELTVASVIRDFRDCLPGATIIIGDNKSTDRTAEIARAEPGCDRVITCPIQGKGAAIRHMILETHESTDIYIMVDGDATYNSKHIKLMLDLMRAHDYDMVSGDRSKSFQGEKITHSFGNRLVDTMVVAKYWAPEVKDVMTGLRVMTKDMLLKYAREGSRKDGFEIETELVIWAVNNNYKLHSIGIDYDRRPEGSVSKLNTFKDGWRIIRLILKTPRSKLRLKKPKKNK